MTAYTRGMTEEATYWPPGAPDGYGGFAATAGQNIMCRWEKAAKQYREANGEIALSEAVVYVDREVAVGGRLAQGADASRADSREIRAAMTSPSFDGLLELTKAMLGKAGT